ncbi:MAG: type I DNA topoisomerase [Candidatus Omnitrophica bacterium]|nr:type I DNA topoisomerase [Candidatus Omnitrophota bacterium]
MAKFVVVVESPAKVKTINKILGNKFKVVASMGHLIDLPKSTLGINIEKDFEPHFIVVRSKTKILSKLKKDVEDAETIYFATDPDREGEAIGWNLVEHLGAGKKIKRVTFQEITKSAVLKAFETPRDFDRQKIDAQVARRVLDRLVGYKISPLLWKKIGSRLSAGRVQSVALRMIVERERAIIAFNPKEYWQIAADLQKSGRADVLTANLDKIDGEKFELGDQKITDDLVSKLKTSEFLVTSISSRTVRKKPNPPFITSTLQQEAFNKLRYNAAKTMMIAQQLYEGIEVGGETIGLITYMRTDSVNLSKDAVELVRKYIGEKHGDKYLPETPNVYKSRKSAQEAHEAIRPSDVYRTPEEVKAFLDADQFKLYQLIWNRFVSCQMESAEYQYRRMEIQAANCMFAASGSTLIFDGHLTVYPQADEEEGKADFSHYVEGDKLNLLELKPTQHFTKPPPRFSEASLVKALEEEGIGRPSTYAAIIQTIVLRNYVLREKGGYLGPTDLGLKVNDLLVEYFSEVIDVGFTAQMEEELDKVEEGQMTYAKLLHAFYVPFKKELIFAEANTEKTHHFVGQKCPDCGKEMVIKWGRRGRFVSCSGFPECKFAKPYTTGIKCPGCSDGELVKRRSPKGEFYGCSKYPKCTYVSNELPEEGKIPEVNS